MKKFISIIVACIMVVMPCICMADEDPVLFTFNGEEYNQSVVAQYASLLYDNGYADSENDYYAAIDYMVLNICTANAKIKEMGYDVFTDEEIASLTQEANDLLESYYQQYVDYFASDESEREAFYAEAVELYAEEGYTTETVLDSLKNQAMFNKLLAGIETNVTEEDIQAAYDEYYVSTDKEYFENDVALFDVYTNQYGYESSYVPEGYRGVLHILLTFDDEAMTAYRAVAGDAESTQEEITSATEQLLATRQADISDIYTRLAGGEEFLSVMADYNEDPGMTGERLEVGYSVHRDSTTWDGAFVNAAFAENMQNIGDYSEPSVGIYGAYIVYYLRDIPSGAVAMSDEIRETIESYLVSNVQYTQITEWASEYEVVYNEDVINSLTSIE